MTSNSDEKPGVPSQQPYFPEVNCGVGTLTPETALEYVHAQEFADTRSEECLQELERLKLQYPDKEIDMLQIVAFERIWEKYRDTLAVRDTNTLLQ